MNFKEELHAQQAPEVVDTNYPEALGQGHYQQQQYHQYGQPNTVAAAGPEPEGHPASNTLYSGTYQSSNGPFDQHTSPPSTYSRPTYADGKAAEPGDGDGGVGGRREGRRRTILGCTVLVFALWAVIALLTAAVIGLAAGTGIEAHRANVANAALASGAAATTTVTVTSAAPSSTSTSYAAIDDDCSADPTGVTGTTYYSFSGMSGLVWSLERREGGVAEPRSSLSLSICISICFFLSLLLSLTHSLSDRRLRLHHQVQRRRQRQPPLQPLHLEPRHVHGRLRRLLPLHPRQLQQREPDPEQRQRDLRRRELHPLMDQQDDRAQRRGRSPGKLLPQADPDRRADHPHQPRGARGDPQVYVRGVAGLGGCGPVGDIVASRKGRLDWRRRNLYTHTYAHNVLFASIRC